MAIQRQSPYQIQPARDSSLGYVDLVWDTVELNENAYGVGILFTAMSLDYGIKGL